MKIPPILLDTFPKQERALWVKSTQVNNVMAFGLVVSVVLVVVLNYIFLARVRATYCPLILGILSSQEREDCTLSLTLYAWSFL